MPPLPGCTLDEFRGFFLAKAYDVVGNGVYRKHLAKCKEAGDPWAIAMGQHLQAVQVQIREIHAAVAAMPATPNRLGEICKNVMMSAQPPVRLNAGCVVCAITSRRCLKCLDLSKTHKGNHRVYVDPRFCFFFMLLWYCNKMEYIIRCFTRTWLDNRPESETFKSLCCALGLEMEPVIARMHSLFVIGTAHVLATVQNYVKSHHHEPVLEMPAPPLPKKTVPVPADMPGPSRLESPF
jgi:hypothetical protein